MIDEHCGQAEQIAKGPLYVHAKASDIAELEAECARLRRQRDDLQAANTRLVGQHRDERVERIAAEERAESLQRRVDGLHTALLQTRTVLGAAVRESALDAAKRVVSDRDAARRVCDVYARVAQEARERADAAERLAHEAEAQREAAARGLTIRALVEQSHALSRSKGWYDNGDPNLGERLMLVVTEVAEAMEDYRRGRMTTTVRDDGKPEGFPSEIADVVIRIADMCGAMGIDLEAEIQRKHSYNETRPYRHGGKVA